MVILLLFACRLLIKHCFYNKAAYFLNVRFGQTEILLLHKMENSVYFLRFTHFYLGFKTVRISLTPQITQCQAFISLLYFKLLNNPSNRHLFLFRIMLSQILTAKQLTVWRLEHKGPSL